MTPTHDPSPALDLIFCKVLLSLVFEITGTSEVLRLDADIRFYVLGFALMGDTNANEVRAICLPQMRKNDIINCDCHMTWCVL